MPIFIIGNDKIEWVFYDTCKIKWIFDNKR